MRELIICALLVGACGEGPVAGTWCELDCRARGKECVEFAWGARCAEQCHADCSLCAEVEGRSWCTDG